MKPTRKSKLRSCLVLGINATLLYLACAVATAQQCPAGFTDRLVLVNKSSEDIWLIETPPGSQQAVQAQWDWFRNLATVTHTLPNGGVMAAFLIKAGNTQHVCVPDKGAPGGRFHFHMGCPNNNTDPFNPA